MDYLKAAIELKKYIKEVNQLVSGRALNPQKPNNMFLQSVDGTVSKVEMEKYTNEFVLGTLGETKVVESFVITDLATMNVQGQELTYWLYKGYNSKVDNGLVYFQVVDKDSMKPKGELQFSNLEKNIFFTVEAPDFEESSSNAMEPDEEIEGKKSIVFLVGHMNEQRLIFDIQRLIVDTVNNIQRHVGISFHFIINISKFNGSPSDNFKGQVKEIEQYTKNFVTPEYPNAEFVFDIEE